MATMKFPILYIPDPFIGRPLFNAKIFVGEPGLDPEDGNGNPINSKQLRVVLNDGSKVNVAQPFVTSAGGVPVYNGVPVELDIEGSYSLKILSNLNVQKYYMPNARATIDYGLVSAPVVSTLNYGLVSDAVITLIDYGIL